jgi:hypothetical protein
MQLSEAKCFRTDHARFFLHLSDSFQTKLQASYSTIRQNKTSYSVIKQRNKQKSTSLLSSAGNNSFQRNCSAKFCLQMYNTRNNFMLGNLVSFRFALILSSLRGLCFASDLSSKFIEENICMWYVTNKNIPPECYMPLSSYTSLFSSLNCRLPMKIKH